MTRLLEGCRDSFQLETFQCTGAMYSMLSKFFSSQPEITFLQVDSKYNRRAYDFTRSAACHPKLRRFKGEAAVARALLRSGHDFDTLDMYDTRNEVEIAVQDDPYGDAVGEELSPGTRQESTQGTAVVRNLQMTLWRSPIFVERLPSVLANFYSISLRSIQHLKLGGDVLLNLETFPPLLASFTNLEEFESLRFIRASYHHDEYRIFDAEYNTTFVTRLAQSVPSLRKIAIGMLDTLLRKNYFCVWSRCRLGQFDKPIDEVSSPIAPDFPAS